MALQIPVQQPVVVPRRVRLAVLPKRNERGVPVAVHTVVPVAIERVREVTFAMPGWLGEILLDSAFLWDISESDLPVPVSGFQSSVSGFQSSLVARVFEFDPLEQIENPKLVR